MTLENLQNLQKTGSLKAEPADQQEFDSMLSSAKRRLRDIGVPGISEEGRFLFAYSAAHTLALAAMRWHGYRSDNRYLVFQCLQHTVGFTKAKWRVLDKCHRQRNLAEYEGYLDVSDQLMDELIAITHELLGEVERLGPVAGT